MLFSETTPFAHKKWPAPRRMKYSATDIGLQARYARPSGRMRRVYGFYGLAGPIWIMYHDMQQMVLKPNIQDSHA